MKIKGFCLFWLPGRDAQQNFFSYQFAFSAPAKTILSAKNHLENQGIKSKRNHSYVNVIELAMKWQKGLEKGMYASRAAIAREFGISRARVTQIMNILRIPGDLLNGSPGNLTERKIRTIRNDVFGNVK